ncbi:MAG: ABC transporter ATP-binding protein, partial [Candidatus Coproplasma sp.]
MLELNDIKKDYQVADEEVHALKGVSIKFRKNEFVSILGPSGCGKTTLLNIIGGLDHYTSGDLIIEGKSTKEYSDREWDTYRNHSIGFIFQSYHLIPHQTILQNVELALMISGVSKRERRRRAMEALEKVGLKDKINNRPNQLSGGQAQRVAIARALINDPEIVLADEPTGALDSKTSVQIMELLKEIAKDRLVIMVTHNPELAQKYSTRIIKLLDGEVVGDTRPFKGEPAPERELTKKELKALKKKKGSKKNSAMSPFMAMSLSLKNLLSKRGRTTMVSVAGSIGIIGVSMVLAISAGVQAYIASMQDDMLSGNPVSVQQSALDFSSLMDMSPSSRPNVDITKLKDKVYVNSLMETLGSVSSGLSTTNNINEAYLSYVNAIDEKYYNVIQYDYGFDVANNIYTDFKVEAGEDSSADGTMSVTAIRGMYTQILREQEEYAQFSSTISTVATFDEAPDNYKYILSQYDIVAAETEGGVITESKDLTDEQLKAIFEDKGSLIMVLADQTV